MLKGVLLDIDGTLVLSNDAHTSAWVEAFVHYGYQVSFQDVRKLIGMGGDKLLPALFPELSDKDGEGKKIKELRSEIFLSKYAPTLEPTPGSRQLVEYIQGIGVKTVVASSASNKELESLLKAAEVKDLLSETTTSDDVDGGSKPDPDIIKAALKKIDLPAEDTVMIADTPYDIEAAQKAGVDCLIVRCGGWKDHDLKGSVAIYDDPAHAVDYFAQSNSGN